MHVIVYQTYVKVHPCVSNICRGTSLCSSQGIAGLREKNFANFANSELLTNIKTRTKNLATVTQIWRVT